MIFVIGPKGPIAKNKEKNRYENDSLSPRASVDAKVEPSMSPHDPTTIRLDSARPREHIRSWRRRVWPYLLALGPGLLAASAGNDAGGIATYASAGASYGYGLLWAMVLVTICVGVVQEMSARMGAVTGKGFSDLVRESFSLRQPR